LQCGIANLIPSSFRAQIDSDLFQSPDLNLTFALIHWNMRSYFLLLLILLFSSKIYAYPDSIRAATVPSGVPASFLNLRITNDSVSANDILNEQLVDMVKVDERDRKVPTPYTTHQGGVLGGWFIRMIGFYWQAVDRQRYKFVGTNRNGLSMPGEKDELTEHDINFTLVPHLNQYMNFVYRGRMAQTKRRQFRRSRPHDLTKPPYIPPTLQTAEIYDLHCELTPPKRMRDSVNALFYPCLHGYNLDKHQNFCDLKPSVGMYGVFVLDCNHSCHPEIHPYEWLWWLKLTAPEKTAGNFNKTWMLGFFKESSNRFILWSQSPRVGTISVPFIFKVSEQNSYLNFSKVVEGKFRPHGIRRMKNLPPQTNSFNFSDTTIRVLLNTGLNFPLHIHNESRTKTPALQWWLSDVQTDEANEWVWGYFNMVVSVKDGYTAKLESISLH